MTRSTTTRPGFTLVELLVVIAIIATLAAILTPAVMMAMSAGVDGAIKLEVTKLEQGIENYKNKHNDYPPDFSEPALVKRHYRKLFPRMAADESAVLDHILNNGSINRAEALVFVLHGYSSDDTHPFTGPGGPLDGTDAATFSGTLTGSTGMTNALVTFEESKITWELDANGSHYVSNEDPSNPDPFPVYLQRGTDTPFVYFDSRTYVYADRNNNGQQTVNHYQDLNNSLAGIAHPYKSNQKNPKPDSNEASVWTGQVPDPNNPQSQVNPSQLKFANSDTFQIITAGQDGKFSELAATASPAEARVYPTGSNYKTEDLDNIVNFSEKSTLEGDLP